MMTKSEIETRLLEIFALVLGRTVPADVARSDEPDWDSLKHMQLVFAVEEEFHVQFAEDQIPRLNSLSMFSECIRQSHAPRSSR